MRKKIIHFLKNGYRFSGFRSEAATDNFVLIENNLPAINVAVAENFVIRKIHSAADSIVKTAIKPPSDNRAFAFTRISVLSIAGLFMLLLFSCSKYTYKTAYNSFDSFAMMQIDSYFIPNDIQKNFARAKLKSVHSWHRRV